MGGQREVLQLITCKFAGGLDSRCGGMLAATLHSQTLALGDQAAGSLDSITVVLNSRS